MDNSVSHDKGHRVHGARPMCHMTVKMKLWLISLEAVFEFKRLWLISYSVIFLCMYLLENKKKQALLFLYDRIFRCFVSFYSNFCAIQPKTQTQTSLKTTHTRGSYCCHPPEI